VELRFVSPQLGRLDELDAELLFATVFEDERPPHGVAGLCDWRLGGRVARLLEEGFFTGALGDVILVPGRPRTTFDKICLFGAGQRARFDEAAYVEIVRRMLRTMTDLRARGGVVELPGRHAGLLAPERAAESALEEASAHRGEIDVWVLVEGPAARAAIEKLVFEQKRRRQRIEGPVDLP
jgi:hypothetical protein